MIAAKRTLSVGLLVLLTSLFFSCVPVNQSGEISSPGRQAAASSLRLDEAVSVRLIEADVRRSYQVYYLMKYPTEDNVFLRVLLAIGGIAEPAEWGRQKVTLRYGQANQTADLVRPFTVGDGYQYLSLEPIELLYEFIYQVPLDSFPLQAELIIDGVAQLPLPPLTFSSPEIAARVTAFEPEALSLSGARNQAQAEGALVVGGRQNQAQATFTTVGGGLLNQATMAYATVGGGRENQVAGFYSSIAGGYGNQALARDVAIAGGSRNTAEGRYAAIGGGIRNRVGASSATISGGAYNQAQGLYSSIGGGTRNMVTEEGAVVAGGVGNHAGGRQAAVLGGLDNLAGGSYAVSLAGYGNRAQGDYAATLGGSGNQASADYSLAAGRQALVGPDHSGALLLADGSEAEFASSAANEFAVRATGGVRLVTAIDQNGDTLAGVSLAAGSGSWSQQSDAALKQGWQPVEVDRVLAQLNTLEIGSWRYIAEADGIRHLGPTAQAFSRAFGLGADERTIDSVDADGVALAGIQALSAEQDSMVEQFAELEQRVGQLEATDPSLKSGMAATAGFALLAGAFGLFVGFTLGVLAALTAGRLDSECTLYRKLAGSLS